MITALQSSRIKAANALVNARDELSSILLLPCFNSFSNADLTPIRDAIHSIDVLMGKLVPNEHLGHKDVLRVEHGWMIYFNGYKDDPTSEPAFMEDMQLYTHEQAIRECAEMNKRQSRVGLTAPDGTDQIYVPKETHTFIPEGYNRDE